jgi:DMSO/TMAO reductase YedYZ heme-binding membrane subunit
VNLVWYIARAGGIVAWALLTASVLWGLALSSKFFGRRVKPSWLLDLHRYLGGLAVVFAGVHVGSLLLDHYAHIGVEQLLIPFTSSYRPGAIAVGVVSLDLLVAIQVSSLVRHKLPRQLWRNLHMLSFPLFFLASLHGVTAGTDGHSSAFRALVATAVAAVTFLFVFRFYNQPAARSLAVGETGTASRSGAVRSTRSPMSVVTPNQ